MGSVILWQWTSISDSNRREKSTIADIAHSNSTLFVSQMTFLSVRIDLSIHHLTMASIDTRKLKEWYLSDWWQLFLCSVWCPDGALLTIYTVGYWAQAQANLFKYFEVGGFPVNVYWLSNSGFRQFEIRNWVPAFEGEVSVVQGISSIDLIGEICLGGDRYFLHSVLGVRYNGSYLIWYRRKSFRLYRNHR